MIILCISFQATIEKKLVWIAASGWNTWASVGKLQNAMRRNDTINTVPVINYGRILEGKKLSGWAFYFWTACYRDSWQKYFQEKKQEVSTTHFKMCICIGKVLVKHLLIHQLPSRALILTDVLSRNSSSFSPCNKQVFFWNPATGFG